jgi:hypothetical protein
VDQHGAAQARLLTGDPEDLAAVAIEAGGEGGDAKLGEEIGQPLPLGLVQTLPMTAHRQARHEREIEGRFQDRRQGRDAALVAQGLCLFHDLEQRRVYPLDRRRRCLRNRRRGSKAQHQTQDRGQTEHPGRHDTST